MHANLINCKYLRQGMVSNLEVLCGIEHLLLHHSTYPIIAVCIEMRYSHASPRELVTHFQCRAMACLAPPRFFRTAGMRMRAARIGKLAVSRSTFRVCSSGAPRRCSCLCQRRWRACSWRQRAAEANRTSLDPTRLAVQAPGTTTCPNLRRPLPV